ncbi:MAG: hypothetical protein QXF15_03600 [Candidatus Aenigmatarchaeota archaeon]
MNDTKKAYLSAILSFVLVMSMELLENVSYKIAILTGLIAGIINLASQLHLNLTQLQNIKK